MKNEIFIRKVDIQQNFNNVTHGIAHRPSKKADITFFCTMPTDIMLAAQKAFSENSTMTFEVEHNSYLEILLKDEPCDRINFSFKLSSDDNYFLEGIVTDIFDGCIFTAMVSSISTSSFVT